MAKSPTPQPIKHKGHTQTMERGSWGPHTAKIVCISCGGEFVKWASTKHQQNQQLTTCKKLQQNQ